MYDPSQMNYLTHTRNRRGYMDETDPCHTGFGYWIHEILLNVLETFEGILLDSVRDIRGDILASYN